MEKMISFGKIDYFKRGKKTNEVIVTINLKKKKGKSYIDLKEGEFYALSISADILDIYKNDVIIGGQCLDKINNEFIDELNNKELFLKIYDLWKEYHLNDLIAGTIEQEKELKNFKERPKGWSYPQDVEYLKKNNLFEVKGHKYGYEWLIRTIPEHKINLIQEIIKNN